MTCSEYIMNVKVILVWIVHFWVQDVIDIYFCFRTHQSFKMIIWNALDFDAKYQISKLKYLQTHNIYRKKIEIKTPRILSNKNLWII